MNTRPVLSMSFYQSIPQKKRYFEMSRPYQQMRIQAYLERQRRLQRIANKKKNANKVISNLTMLVGNFFPEIINKQNEYIDIYKKQVKQLQNYIKMSDTSKNQATQNDFLPINRVNKYSREYFESLHQNLRQINSLVDQLDPDI